MEKTKKVYGFDPITFEFAGTQYAHLCPVTKKEYLIPANTIEIEPPKPKEDYAIVLENGKWKYVLDERGKDIYDCQTGERVGHVNNLFGDIKDNQTTKEPPKGGIWKEPDPSTPEEIARNAILKNITDLETQITSRRLREAIIGIDNNWLKKQENLIQIERDKLNEKI